MTGKHKNEHEENQPQTKAPETEKPEINKGETQTEASDEQKITPPENSPAEKLAAKDAEIAALNDKYLRLYSEFDNYRKRTLRERIELSKTASADIISLLLPVIDDMERAIKAHNETETPITVLQDGEKLIYNKLINLLKQNGLEPINAIGEEFSTDFHEAVTNIPAPEPGLKGKIVDEIQKGYSLNGKVIRYSKVVVGS
ncbi:MAG TPA: nucleotide exchange factor GrpE [Bacteroidales bacterium]|nr:nucleotide exchange factor GrpE [Bacteroidales bacterium]HPS73211.1 nucleotide exchange factor GrpE [Bacteroidales bacterium]